MNSKFTVVLSVAVVIAIGGYFYPKVLPQFGAEAGPVKTEGQEHLGGTTFSHVNSTTSSSITYTLVAGDLARQGFLYDTIVFELLGVPGGGTVAAATTTWTLPASSTMPHVLPKLGQRASVCFSVATTSGAGLILAEGTGFGIETASTTSPNIGGPGSRTVTGGTTACGWVVRGINNAVTGGQRGFNDLTLILAPTTEAQ